MTTRIQELLDYMRLAYMMALTFLRWLRTRGEGKEGLEARLARNFLAHEAARQARRLQDELGRVEAHTYLRDEYGTTYTEWLARQADEAAALAADPVELARRLARATARDKTLH